MHDLSGHFIHKDKESVYPIKSSCLQIQISLECCFAYSMHLLLLTTNNSISYRHMPTARQCWIERRSRCIRRSLNTSMEPDSIWRTKPTKKPRLLETSSCTSAISFAKCSRAFHVSSLKTINVLLLREFHIFLSL